ncbi:MAG: homoserine dehydrogenase [Promethearchaeota archaeon]
MVNLAIIGMGVVGRQVIKIIHDNHDEYLREYNIDIKIVAIFEIDGALINEEGLNLDEIINTKNIRDLKDWKPGIKAINEIKKINADIIGEITPVNPKTGEPALSHIRKALSSGKHVITSNKGPFYLKYNELKELAAKNNVTFGFESTVGSAMPVLSAKRTLAGNKIKKIIGILNGTSNYILSRMADEGINFKLALQEAQELGYAEADPTLDIEGYDAAGKLVILANHLMGWNKTINDVEIHGITDINKDIIALAKKNKLLVKHLGIAKDGKLEVSLKLIPETSPLALKGTLNAVWLETENAGEIIFIGRGAGGPEAASGIISDLINICKEYNLK